MHKYNNLIKVAEHNVALHVINVMVLVGTTPQVLDISKDKFEKWLVEEDRLQWEINGMDHTGEHTQTSGTLSIEDYWEQMHREQIKYDLRDFISSTMLNSDKINKAVIDSLKAA